MDVYPSKERLAEVKKQGIDVLSFVEMSSVLNITISQAAGASQRILLRWPSVSDYKIAWKLPEETSRVG
jgi:hypothetical protein